GADAAERKHHVPAGKGVFQSGGDERRIVTHVARPRHGQAALAQQFDGLWKVLVLSATAQDFVADDHQADHGRTSRDGTSITKASAGTGGAVVKPAGGENDESGAPPEALGRDDPPAWASCSRWACKADNRKCVNHKHENANTRV